MILDWWLNFSVYIPNYTFKALDWQAYVDHQSYKHVEYDEILFAITTSNKNKWNILACKNIYLDKIEIQITNLTLLFQWRIYV